MKTIYTYISEKFQVGKNNIRKYAYHPKNKGELIKVIQDKINKEGLGTEENPLDLNDIDTSEIMDMSLLFNVLYGSLKKLSENGNFDISEWDVSNVKDMEKMFMNSSFNGDISYWDVSNVENMSWMFCFSEFSGGISNWDVSKVENMEHMFYDSDFNANIDKWNVSKVKNMFDMFTKCPIEDNPPKWYHE